MRQEDRDAVRLWLRLLSCTNVIEGRLRTRLRERFGTTLPQFDVLAQLEAAGTLTMSELSRRLMVSNGNLTGLTGRLAREGLLTRTASSTDRRAQLVRLTPAGRRALRTMAVQHHGWVRSMLGGLTPQQRGSLHAMLGRLHDTLERQYSTGGPR